MTTITFREDVLERGVKGKFYAKYGSSCLIYTPMDITGETVLIREYSARDGKLTLTTKRGLSNCLDDFRASEDTIEDIRKLNPEIKP